MNPSGESRHPAAFPLERSELEQPIGDRLARVVEQFPDHRALECGDVRYTYRELLAEVQRIAAAVAGNTPPGPGCVANLVDHSPEMVFCPLGVVTAGKASLGIHPGLPASAQREIIQDALPELLLTTAAHEPRALEITAGTGCRVVRLDSLPPVPADGFRGRAVDAGDPATILYTSGSTGRPKGVVRSHRAVLHRLWLAGQLDGIAPGARQSLLTFGSFASAEVDLFGPLLFGATTCLFDVASRGLAPFAEWIGTHGITHLHPPVLLFRRCLQMLEPDVRFPSVRLVAVAGDVVQPSDLALWRRHFPPGSVLMHRFSITETALLAVERIEHDAPAPTTFVPAGRPVQDKTVEVVDAEGRLLPPGETGEIRVRSRYLASGYWRRPEETEAAFKPDPEVPGGRIYRTGDLGRFLEDGRLVVEGRRDHQVKIRGYRIEIREVEAAIQELEGIQEAAVVVRRQEGDARLMAFVVGKAGHSPDVTSLGGRLRSRLAEWKIPSEFRVLESLPTTPTGKVDRPALSVLSAHVAPAPVPASGDSSAMPRTPREEEWVRLWARVLGLKTVGIHDDFFRLGGHSLQAMQLVFALERSLGRRVALADLMANPTVAAFSGAAEGGATSARGPGRVFRGAERGVPWFHIPGIYGVEFLTPSLAQAIGRHRPYFDGLEYPGLNGNSGLLTDVEALAAEMVRQITAICPTGPVALSGFSFGGTVAYAAARQLTAAGRPVEMLVLLDTYVRGAMRRRSVPEQIRVLAGWARARPMYLPNLLRLKLKTWLPVLGRRILRRPPERRKALELAAKAARIPYRMQPYSGRIELMLATLTPDDDTGRWEKASDNGWGPFLHDGFKIHPVACDHGHVYLEPVSPDVLEIVGRLAAERSVHPESLAAGSTGAAATDVGCR